MRDIESRLVAAGAAWRAEQATTATYVEVSDRRRRWLPAVAAVVVVVLAVAVTALAGRLDDRPAPSPPAGPVGAWEAMPPGPLSARVRPIVASWAGAVVIVGGREDPCPPNAGCARDPRETLRDGAVYDVRSRTWRSLPPAPVPLDVFSSAVVGDVLYLWLPADGGSPARLLALDLAQGRWESAPAPPTGGYCCLRLIAAGARLIGYALEDSGSAPADYSYDPATKRWQPLPTAPFGGSFDRAMVWTGTEVVLVTPGPPPGRSTSSGPPYLKAAVLERDSWRVLPDQQTVIGSSVDWTWAGSRVVSATTYEADGGRTNGFGRSIPAGGQLDPATGTWSELPPAPVTTTVSGVVAADSRYVANGEGLVFDVEEQRWLELPAQPDGADQDAGGAWAGGRLVVWGGVRWSTSSASPGGRMSYSSPRLLTSGAVWTPSAKRAAATREPSVEAGGCRRSALTVTATELATGVTGQSAIVLQIENDGRATCRLDGYPALTLLDATGGPLPFFISHGGSQAISAARPEPVDIPAGSRAYAAFGKYRCDAGDRAGAVAVDVLLPGVEQAIRVSLVTTGSGVGYCGPEDPGSGVTVSAVMPDVASTQR